MEFELPILSPSILAADYSNLGNQLQLCEKAGTKWIHCDIMDGHFVPNISFGPDVVAAVRDSAPNMFLETHLMIENPDNYIEAFADAGSELITVHLEACPHLHRTLNLIQLNGCMTGVAINPATSLELIRPVLKIVDLVVIMTVNPGFGGQTFIESSYEKIQRLTAIRMEEQTQFLIETDGGVGLKNIQKLVKSGADILVAGSSIFRADDIPERIELLRKKANLGRKDFV